MTDIQKTPIQWNDVQGFLLSGFGRLEKSRFLFLHFTDPAEARNWLRTVEVTTANRITERKENLETAVSLAFSCEGLKALGYPESDLKEFAPEFVTGMADSERARRLGDLGKSDPGKWEIGNPGGLTIHALLILKALTEDELDRLQSVNAGPWRLAASIENGSSPAQDHREHFGFVDGISQPEIEGSPLPAKGDIVRTGEFILGYPNAYDMLPSTPTLPDLSDFSALPESPHALGSGPRRRDFGKNGTYLVFRKLEQDVKRFRDFVAQNSQPGDEDLFSAKLVGRWQSGVPLTQHPDADPLIDDAERRVWSESKRKTFTNDFGYRNDREGLKCPLGAHIRRANPRDDLEHNARQSLISVERHRILRRGVLYGPRFEESPAAVRGLYFICLNANIRRQFEFMQQTWLNSPKFSGLRNDRDPIAGNNFGSAVRNGRCDMTVQASPARQRHDGLPRFVTMKGGGYFFLPSITALRFLSGVRG